MASLGEVALRGEWEKIATLYKFCISEDMDLHFDGMSCRIVDEEGRGVKLLTKEDGETKETVYAGYECEVMKARVKFVKIRNE